MSYGLARVEQGMIYLWEDGEEKGYVLATFWERVGARLIDGLIMFIPANIVPLIAPWLYYSLMHSSDGNATVGQKALKLQLKSVDGMRVTFGQATGRFFANILNVLTFLIGYFMMFGNAKQQCLHDMLAGTVVVKVDPYQTPSEYLDAREY